MNKVLIIIFLYISNLSSSIAQDARTDALYERIQEKIKRKEYYLNEIKLNSNRLSRHFKVQPNHSEKYYYVFQGKSSPVLHFIATQIEIGDLMYHSEYVFDSKTGKLLLYLERQNDAGKYAYRKLKVYFNDIKHSAVLKSQEENTDMLNGFEKTTDIDLEEIKKIMSSFKYYKEKFYLQIDEVMKK